MASTIPPDIQEAPHKFERSAITTRRRKIGGEGKPNSNTMKSDDSNKFKTGVLNYYEKNTPWFQCIGTANRAQTIHRAVWAEGITDRQRALDYVDDQILKQILTYKWERSLEHVRVFDLGCGVGGSLQKLAGEMGETLTAIGITLSTRQAWLAKQRSIQFGTQARCTFLAADFHAMPFRIKADIALSVESFAHAIEPETYFAEVARVLKPGGQLIVFDDFQSADSTARGSKEADRRWLQLFKSGWRVPHLLSPPQVADMAQKYRFRKAGEKDLTRYIRKRTLPKHLIPFLEFTLNQQDSLHPLFGSIIGGLALEHCVASGLVTYRFLLFEKQH